MTVTFPYLDNISRYSFPIESTDISTLDILDSIGHDKNVQLLFDLEIARESPYLTSKQEAYLDAVITELGKCGVEPISKYRSIKVINTDSYQGIAGVQRCDKELCPSCAVRRGARRRAKLNKRRNEIGTDNEYQHIFITSTVQHSSTDSLKTLLQAQQKAIKTIQQRRYWKAVAGFVRTLHVTHGSDGYHPHFHYLITLKSAAVIDDFLARLKADWSEQIFNNLGVAGNIDVEKNYNIGGIINYLTGKKAPKEDKEPAQSTEMSPLAFAELYCQTYRLHWNSEGGIWKSKKQKPELPQLEAEEVLTIPWGKWQAIGRYRQHQFRLLLKSRTASVKDINAVIADLAVAV